MSKLEGHPGLDKTLAACLGLAFAALVLSPSTRLFDPKAAAALALGALLFLGGALALASDAPHAWRFPPLALNALWACAALAFLVALLSSPYRRLLGSIDPTLPCAACVSLGLACAPRVWGRSLLQAWRVSLLVLCLYALAQRAGFEPYSAYAQAGSQARAMATYGNPDYFAAFLCLSWPLLLDWQGWRKTSALSLAFAALFSTQSRAALLAVFIQASVLLFLKLYGRSFPGPKGEGDAGSGAGSGPPGAAWNEGVSRPGAGIRVPLARAWHENPLILILLAAVLAAAATLFFFPVNLWLRPTLRWPLWQASVDLWLQRPWFGWGPGAFALAFQDHAPAAFRGVVNAGNQYAEAPHQFLLGLACSAGCLGLAAFAACLYCFRRFAASAVLPGAPALALGALGLFVESQADRFFFSPGVLVPLAAACGLLAWREREAPAPLAAPSPRTRAVLAWVCMALTFACAWSAAMALMRSRQGIGASLDAGVGVLASAGDPGGLASRTRADPKDAMAWERLGDALAARHEYGDAARALSKALALQPTAGRAQNLGDCDMMLARLPPAEAAFRLAVRLAPDSADAHFSLGYALYDEKRLKEALAELDAALRLSPGHAGAAQLKRQMLR